MSSTLQVSRTSSPFSAFVDVKKRKKSQDETTREGVVVNTFIRDIDTYRANLPVSETPLPPAMYEDKKPIAPKWYNNPIFPMIATPIILLGLGAGLTKAYKNSFKDKFKIPPKNQIPNFGRIVTINDDNKMVLLLLVQDPSVKSLLSVVAVFAASATGFIMKNVADGTKEILVKKQFADIKRSKEERLIDIETKSFSGKNQIIRSMISQKAKEMDEIEKVSTENTHEKGDLSFEKFKKSGKSLLFGVRNPENKTNETSDKKTAGKYILYSVLALGTAVAAGVFTKSIFKNIGSIAKHMENIKNEVSCKVAEDLSTISEDELRSNLKKSQLSQEAKQYVVKEWQKANGKDQKMESAPDMWGKPGMTSLSSVVSDVTSFIYTYILEPNPQTRNLALLLCSSAALSYAGEKTVEAVKEVKVEKANADTEVALQDRLVQVELQNFYSKKQSYIKPLIDDYKIKLQTPKQPEEVKKLKENVLTEIKSGPPFVYS